MFSPGSVVFSLSTGGAVSLFAEAFMAAENRVLREDNKGRDEVDEDMPEEFKDELGSTDLGTNVECVE